MKTLRLFSFLAVLMATAHFSFAQSAITETIPVSGNCGMCKSTIEKTAKKAGATSASWDMDAKMLTVTYSSSSTSAAKIQQGIAAAGYDTRDFKAADEAYDKLHGCCKYERAAASKTSCCTPGKCEKKDGKCADMAGCKDTDCCKNGSCGKKS